MRVLAVQSAIDFPTGGNRCLFGGEKFTILHHGFGTLFHDIGKDLTAFVFKEGLEIKV